MSDTVINLFKLSKSWWWLVVGLFLGFFLFFNKPWMKQDVLKIKLRTQGSNKKGCRKCKKSEATNKQPLNILSCYDTMTMRDSHLTHLWCFKYKYLKGTTRHASNNIFLEKQNDYFDFFNCSSADRTDKQKVRNNLWFGDMVTKLSNYEKQQSKIIIKAYGSL